MKPKQQFKPQNLRTLLAILLALLLLGGGAAFYWGLGIVRDYSVEVSHRQADADASGKQIQELQLLKTQLTQSNSLVEKANQLFATQDSYQSQLLKDVEAYAAAAGLSITNTSLSDGASTGVHTLTVTFNEPVSYSSLITFLTNIESNLPKLQVSSIALGHVDGNKPDSVKTGEIKIDITVR